MNPHEVMKTKTWRGCRWATAVRSAFAIACLALLSACGDDEASVEAAPETPAQSEIERRIAEVQNQLSILEKQSAGLRSDTIARIEDMENTRRRLANEVSRLNAALGKPSLPVVAAPEAPAPDVEAAEAAEAEEDEGLGLIGRFFVLVLFIAILAALVFLGSIFMRRWGPDAEDEAYIVSGGPAPDGPAPGGDDGEVSIGPRNPAAERGETKTHEHPES